MPVPVMGMGCITAAGRTLRETLEGFSAPHAPRRPALFAPECEQPVFQCDMPEDNAQWTQRLRHAYPPDIATQMNRTAQLALLAVDEALHHAGLAPAELKGRRVGICVGTSVGASLDLFAYYKEYSRNSNALDPVPGTIFRYLHSNPALAIQNLLGVQGPTLTVTNACSSGADALGIAASWLQQGVCDMAIAGGADAISYITYLGFRSLKILSPEWCKPFDANRKGLNIGEGAGMVILKRPDPASAEASCFGAIMGYGTATDAHHLTAPHPDAVGLKKALGRALDSACVTTKDIAFINAHGTGTPTNDLTEGRFFGEFFPNTPFISSKGLTGHTLGAAGAIEAIITLSHLHLGALPASIGFEHGDAALGVTPVAATTPITGAIAMSQSLAFGGNNSVLILKKGTASCLWQ